MLDHQKIHHDLFEQISRLVCNKPADLNHDACFKTKNGTYCLSYDKCRIFEKTTEQLLFVSCPLSENLFLTACPGSGKTEVVGLKAAFEIKKWKHGYKGIAFLTFTNNATSVIQERAAQAAGEIVGYPHYIGTIDSWLHRYFAQPFGHTITHYGGKDCDCSIRLVENSSEAYFLQNYSTKYSFFKRGNVKANQYYLDLQTNKIIFSSGNNEIDQERNGWVLEDWQKKDLRSAKKKFLKSGFANYQDIEYICYWILQNPRYRKLIATRFPFLVIDECQDLSGNQLVLLEQLINEGVYSKFIGDLQQSIYEFKGVTPAEIKDFVIRNNFNTLRLNDNFRSVQPIVDLCSKLVNCEGIVGRREEAIKIHPCLFVKYQTEDDMVKLPKTFMEIIQSQRILDPCTSAILARNYGIIGKLRSHGNSRKLNSSLFPAVAINIWNIKNRTLEQTDEAISLFGDFISRSIFRNNSSNSRMYYCPDCISSPIQWRVFLAKLMSELIKIDSLVNFQQPWSKWGKIFRENLENLFPRLIDEIEPNPILRNPREPIIYRIPNGRSKFNVSEDLKIIPNYENNVRITTFHKIKGETADAVMVVSNSRRQGGGHWLNWLENPLDENARFAYVASSRPKHLLIWALPARSVNEENKKTLEELGFIEYKDAVEVN